MYQEGIQNKTNPEVAQTRDFVFNVSLAEALSENDGAF